MLAAVTTYLINYLRCLISLVSDFIAIIFTHLHGIKVQRLQRRFICLPRSSACVLLEMTYATHDFYRPHSVVIVLGWLLNAKYPKIWVWFLIREAPQRVWIAKSFLLFNFFFMLYSAELPLIIYIGHQQALSHVFRFARRSNYNFLGPNQLMKIFFGQRHRIIQFHHPPVLPSQEAYGLGRRLARQVQ